jgi:hypothetical protein
MKFEVNSLLGGMVRMDSYFHQGINNYISMDTLIG